jgi:hypothetical protein
MLLGCPTQAPVHDAGEETEVPYDGETPGGAIPIVPDAEPDAQEDGGEVVVDNRCCQLRFSIPDLEGADTSGRLVATYGPLAGAGVGLDRDGGVWSAAACMPVKASISYWFELTPDAGVLDDGGVAEVTVLVRYDQNAPSGPGLSGVLVNVFGPVNDCSEVDAGTGMWTP